MNASTSSGYALANPRPNAAWLARRIEPIVEPDLPIVDAHHHLWDIAHPRYLFDDLVADVTSGHAIRATVFIEAEAMYRAGGPDEMRPVGEVEFAAGMAAMGESGLYGPTHICAAIVGHADLGLGDRVEPVLEALDRAGGGRFRGVRHSFGYDHEVRMRWAPGLLGRADYRAGFARLQRLGFTYDAWMYHRQLPDLVALLEVNPDAKVVVNHIGGRIRIGRYAPIEAEERAAWRADLARLALFPNVFVKLGGLGMALAGYGFHDGAEPPSSDAAAAAWRPAIESAIELFSPSRCMFESNFPVDKAACSYPILWNAFKKMTAHFAPADRAALFNESATRFYRLPR